MRSEKLHITFLSHLYPTNANPVQGKFIKEQAELINDMQSVCLSVLVPTPYSFPFTARYQRNHASLTSGFAEKASYLSFPKKKFPKIISGSISKNVLRHLQNKEVDLVHAHWLYPDGLCIPALKQSGNTCLLTIQGSDWFKNIANSSLRPLLLKALEYADRILLVGPQLLSDIQKELPHLEHKLHQINNFVDGDSYHIPSDLQKKAALEALGWDGSKKHLLCIANHRKEKGVDLLARAANEVLSKHGNIQFHLVGAADSESIQIYPPDKDFFTYPPVKPDELITYYLASDAYISPSRSEGFGLTLIEAASTGLPLVATPTGIAPSFIDKGNGILCPEISVNAIRDSILTLLECIDEYSARYISNKAKQLFGKEEYKKNLLRHYRELTG